MPVESYGRNEHKPGAEEVMPMDLGSKNDASEDEVADEEDDDLAGDLCSEDGGSFKPEDTERNGKDGDDDDENEDEGEKEEEKGES